MSDLLSTGFPLGARDYNSLSSEDRVRFDFLTASLFRNYENIFYQHKEGAIDDALWAGWSWRIRTTFSTPGVKAWWRRYSSAFSGDFAAYLESNPSSGPSEQPVPPSAAQHLSGPRLSIGKDVP